MITFVKGALSILGLSKEHSILDATKTNFVLASYLGLAYRPAPEGVTVKWKVNPKAFGPRYIPCKATLEPTYPIPTEHNVMRVSGPKDVVCMENNGFVSVTSRLQISDRKALGVRTKGRQFSLLYKVECANFKEVLNEGLNKKFVNPVDNSLTYDIGSVSQTFTGTWNNIPLAFTVTQDTFGQAFTTLNNDYLKVLIHEGFIDYNNKASAVSNVAGTVMPPVNYDPKNLQNTTGLYVIKDYTALFSIGSVPKQQIQVNALANDQVARGRELPVTVNIPASQTQSQTASQNCIDFFSPFSALPISFTIYQANIPGSGLTTDPSFTASSLEFEQKSLPDILNLPFLITHKLIIESRQTTFTVNKLSPNSTTGNPSTQSSDPIQTPLIFTYYEDNNNFERAFVNADYLGAALHKVILSHVQQTHGPRVIYNSLIFKSYEEKEWFQNGIYCKKGSLNEFASKEIPFKLIQVGQNPIDVINFRTNLLFTGEFAALTGNFYKCNRYITCSAFTSQNEIAAIQYQGLFSILEKAFVEPIILSDYPLVKLIPAFERGTIIQLADKVFFKGLVSNASNGEEP